MHLEFGRKPNLKEALKTRTRKTISHLFKVEEKILDNIKTKSIFGR